MDISLDDVIHFDVITSNPSTGAAVDADSTPTFAIYEEDTDTAIVTGNFTKRTSLTGNYRGTATLSAANGFEVGKWYNVIASATVGAVAGKAVVKTFNVVAAPGTTGGLSIVGSAMTLAANSVNADGYTLDQTLKLLLAAVCGKLSGAGTDTETFRAANDTKNRIVATVDETGNRSAITLDAT